MIHHCTFNQMPSAERATVNMAPFGKTPVYVSPWAIIKKALEDSNDSFIWVVTRSQLPKFLVAIKKFDLEKYCIVKHTSGTITTNDYGDMVGNKDDTDGVTNYNYPSDLRKLKVFVMKGEKKQ